MTLPLDYTSCRKTGKLQNVSSVCRKASIADIVFLVDGPWSIGTKNFKVMQDFLYTMVNGFDIGQDKICVSMIQYSDVPYTEFLLNTNYNKNDILQKIQKLHYKGGGTKTRQSLQLMLEYHFIASAGSQKEEGVPQITVVITNGQAEDNVQNPATAIKGAGITLYAIGVKGSPLSKLQEIASELADKHVYEVEDFASLQGLSHSILQMLCTTLEEIAGPVTQVAYGMS
ncbi:LOW QUALITY PROTEIN: collagen alpha-1(XII) chain-like [Pelecanus crispus]|uniref:LOW QUALITY PROTEIN: collagen alpha-1(XII) chain-like n=1 Tax=Pelecanus crispus TaxID=36300 RepID=UPI003F5CFF1D